MEANYFIQLSVTQLESKVINRLKEACGAKNVLMEYEDRYCYAYDATAIARNCIYRTLLYCLRTPNRLAACLKLQTKTGFLL